jgi:hydroxymethylpyrimidine/phosphomethylpyrimidine kinase
VRTPAVRAVRGGIDMIANALTIAGADSGGGAGIQADLKTFSALGVYGASVITALTAQNTRAIRAIHEVPPAFIAAQIDAVFEDIRIDAVKIGMLGSLDAIDAVAAGIERYRPQRVVLDPVMAATTGARLLPAAAVERLRMRLLPLATVLTPNAPEAAELLAQPPITSNEDEMIATCKRLLTLGPRFVLLKGGHLAGAESVDILTDGKQTLHFTTPRIQTRNTHGTGCTLSSAIAAYLARGLGVPEAVAMAKNYLTEALKAADALSVGSGNGPVHHFYALW